MIRICMLAVVLMGLGGCTTIKPWQWGYLSKPEMAGEPDGMNAAMADHIYFSKEGSSGGAAAQGGGCGCN